jgi:hypothetical protein
MDPLKYFTFSKRQLTSIFHRLSLFFLFILTFLSLSYCLCLLIEVDLDLFLWKMKSMLLGKVMSLLRSHGMIELFLFCGDLTLGNMMMSECQKKVTPHQARRGAALRNDLLSTST